MRLRHLEARLMRAVTIPLLLVGALLLITFAVLIAWMAFRFGSDTILGVITQVKGSTADLGPFLMETALIGVATMALIQSIRAIYPVRGLFQQWSVTRWLSEGAGKSDFLISRLLSLAVATDSRAVFDLPAEQLLAQIGAAADLVVGLPRGHEELLFALVGRAGSHDAQNYVEQFHKSRGATKQSDASEPGAPGLNLDPNYVDVRNRVAQHIQRRIDGLQISMGRLWRMILRLTAISIGALVAFVASGPPPQPVGVAENLTEQFHSGTAGGVSPSRSTGEEDTTFAVPNSEARNSTESRPAVRTPGESKDTSRVPFAERPRPVPWNLEPFELRPQQTSRIAEFQRGLFVALTGLVSGFMASLSRDIVAIIEKFRR